MTNRNEWGIAILESVFGILFLCVLFLGTVQIAFSLYGRNVVASSAHEGARAAVERGGSLQDAVLAARNTVQRAAGGLVSDLDVGVEHRLDEHRALFRVTVRATLRRFGIVPVTVRVAESATALRESSVP